MLMDWLRKAPTAVTVAVVIVCGFVACGVLASFVVLQLNGQDTTDLRQWIQTVGTAVILPLLGINTIASVQSARSASNAEDQTNGQLDDKDKQIAALKAQLLRRN